MIILLILKWIGILLLSLLGFLLLLLLLVLFVPVRYYLQGSFENKTPRGKVTLSWLLHLIHGSLSYQDGTVPVCLRIFGIPVLKKNFLEKPENNESPISDHKAPEPETEVPTETAGRLPDSNQIFEAEKTDPKADTDAFTEPEQEEEKEKKEDESQGSSFTADRIASGIDWVKKKAEAFLEKITGVKTTVSGYYKIYTRQATKRAVALAKKQLLRILKSIAPGSYQINMELGFPENPLWMGRLSMIVGMLYPFLYGHGMISLNFEEEKLEGDFKLRGKITLAVFVYGFLRVWLDRDIRRVRFWIKKQKSGAAKK